MKIKILSDSQEQDFEELTSTSELAECIREARDNYDDEIVIYAAVARISITTEDNDEGDPELTSAEAFFERAEESRSELGTRIHKAIEVTLKESGRPIPVHFPNDAKPVEVAFGDPVSFPDNGAMDVSFPDPVSFPEPVVFDKVAFSKAAHQLPRPAEDVQHPVNPPRKFL